MLWGIVVGTYSSLFIAAPLLFYIRPRGGGSGKGRVSSKDIAAESVPAETSEVT